MDGLKMSALPKFTGSPRIIERPNQPTLYIPQYEYVEGKPGMWAVCFGKVNDPVIDQCGMKQDVTFINEMVASYNQNRHSGGVDRTLTIDVQHAAADTGNPAPVIGEILSAEAVIEDGTGIVKLYQGKEAQSPQAEAGDAWLLATCGFYEEYYQMLKDGKVGYQPSVFFTAELDSEGNVVPGTVVWQNLGVVQVPAVGSTPILALNSQKTDKADEGLVLMKGVEAMDDLTKEALQSLLTSFGISQAGIDLVLTSFTPEDGTALMTALQKVPKEPEPTPAETTQAAPSDSARIEALEKAVAELTTATQQSIETTKALVTMGAKGTALFGTPKPAFDKAKRVKELVDKGVPASEAVTKANKEANLGN